ncbi:MAG TPA: PepSY domain-containing protein [Burkholderiales bacterium]|nr:PepSY domain-containing protein [Burkholderiales bacterium]
MTNSGMRSKLPLTIASLLGILMLATATVPAVADDDHVNARKLRESGEIMPLEKIIERARAEKPGEVLETELDRKNGGYVYEVEIVDDAGQVWEIKLDAKTGKLIKVERDD